MQIKACSENDIGDMIKVSTKSYAEHYSYLWHDGGKNYVASNFNYKKFHEEMLNPNCVFFSIQDALRPVGLIKLNIDSATDKFTAALALELERIYLIKDASGRGFGKGAMTFVVNFAKAKSKKIVWLKAMDSSPAVEFYKKSGFVITGETNLNYPQIRAGFQRMFLMQLTL